MAKQENIFQRLRRLYHQQRDVHCLATLAEQRGIDVDEDAAAILRSATKTVEKILARRADMDRDGQYQDPLVVVAGEIHDNIPDIVHHMLVLDGISQPEYKMGVCFEAPHTLLSARFGRYAGIKKIDHKLTDAIKARDPRGQVTLAEIYACEFKPEYRTFFDFMLTRNLPISLNDAASVIGFRNKFTVDGEDPSSAAIMQYCGYAVSNEYGVVKSDGMHIRNAHMERLGRQFISDHNLRILYQQTGNAHVRGYNRWNAPAEQSLAALYKAKSENMAPSIMAVTTSHDSKYRHEDVPKDHIFEPHETHEIDHGLARHYRDPYRNAYLQALLPKVGLADFTHGRADIKHRQKQKYAHVRRHFQRWKTELGL